MQKKKKEKKKGNAFLRCVAKDKNNIHMETLIFCKY